MRFLKVFAALTLAVLATVTASRNALAQSLPSPSPSPDTREALGDAWWTGPLLAPSAGTLPRGHVLIEPYVYDVAQYGNYNSSGKLTGVTHSNSVGNLTYIIYGLANRFSVGLIPTFGINTVSGGPNSTGIHAGDLSALAQYRIALFRPGSWVPTTSISVQQSFPTGVYDNLGDNPANGFGSGAYTTTVSLYTQTYFWMSNGRILRMRVNASRTFSGSAAVNGVSVYGTDANFRGSVKPGGTFTLDLAQEYSITQNWVFALDLVYHRSANTQLTGTAVLNSGAAGAYELAPAVEYNWTPNVGLIFGIRAIPAGLNTSATVTPAMAVNIVH